MQFLAQEGLIVPDDLNPGEDFIELDLASPDVSSRSVGAQHSRWAVRHAHALFSLAQHQTRLKRLERRIRIEKAKYRIRHKGGKKFELDDEITLDPKIKKLEDKRLEIEVQCDLIEAVTKGFELYRTAASREMSRRDSERAPRD